MNASPYDTIQNKQGTAAKPTQNWTPKASPFRPPRRGEGAPAAERGSRGAAVIRCRTAHGADLFRTLPRGAGRKTKGGGGSPRGAGRARCAQFPRATPTPRGRRGPPLLPRAKGKGGGRRHYPCIFARAKRVGRPPPHLFGWAQGPQLLSK